MIELLESYPFIKIDENQKNQLVSYMELTLKANESFNLTANDTKESFMIKNIIDSLLIVKNLDLDGKKVTLEAEGLLAQALQHEIDHLNGQTFKEKILPGTFEIITPQEEERR